MPRPAITACLMVSFDENSVARGPICVAVSARNNSRALRVPDPISRTSIACSAILDRATGRSLTIGSSSRVMITIGSSPMRYLRVDDPLRDPFVVEMKDFLAEKEILKQGRTSRAGAGYFDCD